MAIVFCERCDCRNMSTRERCGKCGWKLGRPHSLEVELAEMEEKDPELKAQAAKVAQAAKDLGLVRDDS